MGPAETSQHAIRRSTRLPLEVPVLLTSLDPRSPISERCNTTLVNAHGCGLIVPRELNTGLRVRLEIVSAKRHTTARVAEVVPLGGDPETWLVGLELDIPGNFWGIDYAPSDWKIEETPSPASSTDTPAPPSAAGSRSRRWRLTDISAGACYLETTAPLPIDTPVLISIRSLDNECLLDGIVRASHPQTGMGIEFSGSEPDELRPRVEALIARLSANHEAPKIFVGRKEQKEQGDPKKPATKTGHPPGNAEAESHDPLLDLVRSGVALSEEQFLSDLHAQRLGKRRDPRVDRGLPVLLSGTDVNGRPLDQRVLTVNISRRGAQLQGVHGELGQGKIISLARLHKKEKFAVAWVGQNNTPKAGQIGVSAVDPNSSFWSDVLGVTTPPAIQPARLHDNTSPEP